MWHVLHLSLKLFQLTENTFKHVNFVENFNFIYIHAMKFYNSSYEQGPGKTFSILESFSIFMH